MIARYITRLRQSPKSVRDRHAFLIATSVTVVVGFVWLATLPLTLEKSPVAEGEDATASRPLASLFARAREQVAQLAGSFKEQTGTTTVSITEVVQAVEATSSLPIITLSPESLSAARAASAEPYTPKATTSPRVIRIATTSSAVGQGVTTTATTTR